MKKAINIVLAIITILAVCAIDSSNIAIVIAVLSAASLVIINRKQLS